MLGKILNIVGDDDRRSTNHRGGNDMPIPRVWKSVDGANKGLPLIDQGIGERFVHAIKSSREPSCHFLVVENAAYGFLRFSAYLIAPERVECSSLGKREQHVCFCNGDQ